MSTDVRHRVMVVGGGFGGLFAARRLAHMDVDVTLVDRRNHHLFQPLLYQVATGMLSAGQIAPPLRHILRDAANTHVLLADVTSSDLNRHVVHAATPGDLEQLELPYDSLIVAAGARQSYFGHDELALHAPGTKTIDEVAMQGGLHAANTIARRLDGKAPATFTYRDLGSVAAIGRFRAIASVHGIRLSGFPGWFVWFFVHLAFLSGFGNRLSTMLRWMRSMIGRGRGERQFSTAHGGGDLSLPPSVRSIVQPVQFPASPTPSGQKDT